MKEHLKKYVQYIKNTSLAPLPIRYFDEDWGPIGQMVRRDLVAAGLITEAADGIRLTEPAQ